MRIQQKQLKKYYEFYGNQNVEKNHYRYNENSLETRICNEIQICK